ncbi:Glyoxylase B2 [Colletotrichum tanaceti]|uniref:Glyoxylase B2 n=1 Tax=Colletotrichum tanaceti TaxID=1306861 RepID=A0A4U6X1Z4_9PEZI|nr:Glyoxylase B2 [Colletotrichum tanaceti]TKW49165.1 Glyoxylase B2 [Colletotrichum tanaceti]
MLDSVLDFDPAASAIPKQTGDDLLEVIWKMGYRVVSILETHVHADHLTAAKYLQSRLREAQAGATLDICIGGRIKLLFICRRATLLAIWANVFAGDSLFDHDDRTGHNYPPAGRGPVAATDIARQKTENKHLAQSATEDDFVKWREGRGSGLGEPRFMHWALQFNIRAGNMLGLNKNRHRLLHVPVRISGATW